MVIPKAYNKIIEEDKRVLYIGRRVRVHKLIKDFKLIDINSKHLIGQYGVIMEQKIGNIPWSKHENNIEYREALLVKIRFDDVEEAYFHKGQLDLRVSKIHREANYDRQ